jgi:hypothetical protein
MQTEAGGDAKHREASLHVLKPHGHMIDRGRAARKVRC